MCQTATVNSAPPVGSRTMTRSEQPTWGSATARRTTSDASWAARRHGNGLLRSTVRSAWSHSPPSPGPDRLCTDAGARILPVNYILAESSVTSHGFRRRDLNWSSKPSAPITPSAAYRAPVTSRALATMRRKIAGRDSSWTTERWRAIRRSAAISQTSYDGRVIYARLPDAAVGVFGAVGTPFLRTR